MFLVVLFYIKSTTIGTTHGTTTVVLFKNVFFYKYFFEKIITEKNKNVAIGE
jgi:hypothetical protein